MSLTIIRPSYPAPSRPIPMRGLSDITDFVIHHSVGPPMQDALAIDAEERNLGTDPFAFIPYCLLINGDGQVIAGRPALWLEGATYGRHRNALSVCLLGNFQEGSEGFAPPPQAQTDALIELRGLAQSMYPYLCRTYAHGDVAALFYNGESEYATECCGSWLRARLPDLKARFRAQFAH